MSTPAISSVSWRQIAWITAAAVVCYFAVRALPTGTNLHQMDFSAGKDSIDFCDPANPQFIPVVAARSPVTLTLNSDGPAATGRVSQFTLKLETSTGKPVGPNDLLEQHTRKLHLLVVDPTLRDYQHIHPEPGAQPGEWTFAITPRLAGAYRVFADFVPVATARGLYASADFDVAGPSVGLDDNAAAAKPIKSPAPTSWLADQGGYHFELKPSVNPIHAGQIADLAFLVTRPDGGPVPLEPVMAAYAHLVAYDVGRSGFAHLHPNELSLTPPPDATHPRLTFKVTIPVAGRYVIWAQVKLNGTEVFVPFWFEVAP